MNREYVKPWVDALRSGKYEQGQKNLLTKTLIGEEVKLTFCCLGVACEEFGAARLPGTSLHVNYEYKGAMDGCCLPRTLQSDMGMTTASGMINTKKNHLVKGGEKFITKSPDGDYYSLMAMNDELKLSFNDIADFIELNWELL